MGAKMADLLTSAQMRAIEAEAIARGAVTGLQLMERAAEGAVAAILAHWPELASPPDGGAAPEPPRYFDQAETDRKQAVVLCGPGNNGGDGFAMARLLHQRGWSVHAFLFGETARLPPDAVEMRRRWEMVGATQGWAREGLCHLAMRLDPARPLLVVDALFGIGLSRPLGVEVTGPWDAFCERASNLSTIGKLYLCAVDVPSGISDAEPEGDPLTWFDDPAAERLTVTFHRLKRAHRAMVAAGEQVRVVDIGLDARLEAQA